MQGVQGFNLGAGACGSLFLSLSQVGSSPSLGVLPHSGGVEKSLIGDLGLLATC